MTLKNSLKVLVFVSSFSSLISCGKMEASIQHPSGVWEKESSKNESTVLSNSPFTGKISFDEVSGTDVKEIETKDTKEVADSKPSVGSADMEGPGVLKPTVYYFAIINEDKNSCVDSEKTVLHGVGGKDLLRVCPQTEKICGLQGSCAVVQNEITRAFNIIGRFQGQDRYFEIEKDGCRFGYGVKSSCLDPFYSLAADLSIYKPGDVIYIPAVVGLELPDGSKHDGYFVVRDQGRGIVGRGRFDFFTGYYSWLDQKNPFNKLGFGDVTTNIPYYRVRGEAAQKVLAHRAFPKLPANVSGGFENQ